MALLRLLLLLPLELDDPELELLELLELELPRLELNEPELELPELLELALTELLELELKLELELELDLPQQQFHHPMTSPHSQSTIGSGSHFAFSM